MTTQDPRSSFADDNRFSDIPIEASDYTSLERRAPTLRFGRFEYKYIIADSARHALENILVRFMELDPHCAGLPTTAYGVTSIYFDSPALDCYHEKQDGLLNRRKFRLRSYDGAATFLEEKGRRNAYSYKKRIPLSDPQTRAALAGQWANLLHAADAPAAEPFSAFVSSGLRAALRPRARVAYRRRAYVARGGYRFRVTLDNDISAADTRNLHNAAARVRPALPGQTIVEIKFEQQIPLWFVRQIQSAQLMRTSISKYCICAETLGIVAPDEQTRNTYLLNSRY